MKKFYTLMAVVLLASMFLSACGGAAPAASNGGAPDCTKAFCVGDVTDVGHVDDKSFNQSTWEGVQNAKKDGFADYAQYNETSDSKDYAKNISTFADAGYKVIVTTGFNLTEPTYAAAKHLVAAFQEKCPGATNDDCILDPGIAPIGSDAEGNLKRLITGIGLIHKDPDMAGVHMSVGLSNFTVMLPAKRADGSPVKGPLESALLTKAMPLGLDMVIGSVKRNYQQLAAEHLTCEGLHAGEHTR